MASYSRPTSLSPDVKHDVFEEMRDATFVVFLNDCKLPVGVQYVSDLDAHCGRTTCSSDVYLESDGLLIDAIAVTQIPERFGYEALARSEICIYVTDDVHASHVRDILSKDREWARGCTAAWLEETLDESVPGVPTCPVIYLSDQSSSEHEIRHSLFYLLSSRRTYHPVCLDISRVLQPKWRRAALECVLGLTVAGVLPITCYVCDSQVAPERLYVYDVAKYRGTLTPYRSAPLCPAAPTANCENLPLLYEQLLEYGLPLEFHQGSLLTREMGTSNYVVPRDALSRDRYTLSSSGKMLYSEGAKVRIVGCELGRPPALSLLGCLVCYPSVEKYAVFTVPDRYFLYYQTDGRLSHYVACALTAHVDHMREHAACKAALVYVKTKYDLQVITGLAEVWGLESVTLVLVDACVPVSLNYARFERRARAFPSCLEMVEKTRLDDLKTHPVDPPYPWKAMTVQAEKTGRHKLEACTEKPQGNVTPTKWYRTPETESFYRMVRCVSAHKVGPAEDYLSFIRDYRYARATAVIPPSNETPHYTAGYAAQNSRPPLEESALGSVRTLSEALLYTEVLSGKLKCGLTPSLLKRALEFAGLDAAQMPKSVGAEWLEKLDSEAEGLLPYEPRYYNRMRKTEHAPPGCGGSTYKDFVERLKLAPYDSEMRFGYTPLEDVVMAGWLLKHSGGRPAFSDLARVQDMMEIFYRVEEPCVEDLRLGSLFSPRRMKPFRYQNACESGGRLIYQIAVYILETTTVLKQGNCILLVRQRGSVTATYASRAYRAQELKDLIDFLTLLSVYGGANLMHDTVAPLFGALFVKTNGKGVYEVVKHVRASETRKAAYLVNHNAVVVYSCAPLVYDVQKDCLLSYTTWSKPVLLPQWQTELPACELQFTTYCASRWIDVGEAMEIHDPVYDFGLPTRGTMIMDGPALFVRRRIEDPTPAPPLKVCVTENNKLYFEGPAPVYLDALHLRTPEYASAFAEKGVYLQTGFDFPVHLENTYARLLNNADVWSCGTLLWRFRPFSEYRRYLGPVYPDRNYAHLFLCDGRSDEEKRIKRYVIRFLGGKGPEPFLLDKTLSLGYAADLGGVTAALLHLFLHNHEVFLRVPSPRTAVQLHALLPTVAYVMGPLPRRLSIYADVPPLSVQLPTVRKGKQEEQKVVVYYTEHLKVALDDTPVVRYVFGRPQQGDFYLSTAEGVSHHSNCNHIVLLKEGEGPPPARHPSVVAYVEPNELPYMAAHIQAIRRYGKTSAQLLYVPRLDPQNPDLRYELACWFDNARWRDADTPEDEYVNCALASRLYEKQLPEDATVKMVPPDVPELGQVPAGYHTYDSLCRAYRVSCDMRTSLFLQAGAAASWQYRDGHADPLLDPQPGDRIYTLPVSLSADAGVPGFVYHTVGIYVLPQSYSAATHYSNAFLLFQSYVPGAQSKNHTAQILNCNPRRGLVSCQVFGVSENLLAGAMLAAQYYGFSKIRVFAADRVELRQWAGVLRKLYDHAVVYCQPWSLVNVTLCAPGADPEEVKADFLKAKVMDMHFILPSLKTTAKPTPKPPAPNKSVAEPTDGACAVISLYINTKLQHAYAKSKDLTLLELINRQHKDVADWVVFAYLVEHLWVSKDDAPAAQGTDRIAFLLQWYQVSKWLCCSLTYDTVPRPEPKKP